MSLNSSLLKEGHQFKVLSDQERSLVQSLVCSRKVMSSKCSRLKEGHEFKRLVCSRKIISSKSIMLKEDLELIF